MIIIKPCLYQTNLGHLCPMRMCFSAQEVKWGQIRTIVVPMKGGWMCLCKIGEEMGNNILSILIEPKYFQTCKQSSSYMGVYRFHKSNA